VHWSVEVSAEVAAYLALGVANLAFWKWRRRVNLGASNAMPEAWRWYHLCLWPVSVVIAMAALVFRVVFR
jgi:hypothetical protein